MGLQHLFVASRYPFCINFVISSKTLSLLMKLNLFGLSQYPLNKRFERIELETQNLRWTGRLNYIFLPLTSRKNNQEHEISFYKQLKTIKKIYLILRLFGIIVDEQISALPHLQEAQPKKKWPRRNHLIKALKEDVTHIVVHVTQTLRI